MKTRWTTWVLTIVALIFLATAAFPVIAQSTGSSFGGGDFGGGGSSSGSSSSYGSSSSGSYGSSSSSGYSSSGYGSSSGGGGGGSDNVACAFLVPFVLFFVAFIIYDKSIPGGFAARRRRRQMAGRGWSSMDVSAIRIGIDWRARKQVQDRLTQLAQSGKTGSKEGLATLLRETILVLKRTELSWLYAQVYNYHPMSAAQAEGVFRQLTVSSRASFTDELVRNADGTTQRSDAPELAAHSHEGEGVVVVTLVVAAKREIVNIDSTDNADQLRRLLDDMLETASPQTLAAMEVIWSPSAEDDRMSSAELEQNYPLLKKIDEESIAGRVFCEYCRGPYAMELLTCPHCGAPGATAQA